ncbi:methyltransferase [Mariniluteicoccus endophyticus]
MTTADHYFTTPEGPEKRRTIRIRAWDTDYEVTTANGVFSYDGLDLGTAVLLRENEPPAGARRILDLGCGWGPIALVLADHCPEAVVDAVDVNERALRLVTDNAGALGLAGRVRALTPDAVEADVAYDEIWSNPPIRIGKEALHQLLLTWLPRLAPDGVARLVVGKNLGADSLQRWLVDQGYACVRTASAKGFRVLEVRRS